MRRVKRTQRKTGETLEYMGLTLEEIEWRSNRRRLCSYFSLSEDGIELVVSRSVPREGYHASLFLSGLGTGFTGSGPTPRRALGVLFRNLPAGIKKVQANTRRLISFCQRARRVKTKRTSR